MTEYIDRVAVRNALYDADAITMRGVKILNQYPASDVVERKTGKWIEDGYYNEPCVCSYCGVPGNPVWNFCPNCGAEMDLPEPPKEEAPAGTYDLLHEEGGWNLQ